MGEGELELCLPSPIFGRGAGGEGKDLSKIRMLPILGHWVLVLSEVEGVVTALRLRSGTAKSKAWSLPFDYAQEPRSRRRGH
jgi:hypothetical protein